MHNRIKIFTLTLLVVCFALLLPFSVLADDNIISEKTLTIKTVEEFLNFCKNCRLDSYSRDLKVILKSDIDLSGAEFHGIPTFGGTFEGNGHTISGLSITEKGSVAGLFRYLQRSAVVRDLSVTGIISPTGSRAEVGGIAGNNSGLIENCIFSGTVAGTDNIGGIVGTNTPDGIIDGCRTEGSVHGNHFVGGITGENLGEIKNCSNSASVNTSAADNSIDISDITLGTLTGSESANTVTDIGGIAGNSRGVIRGCENRGNVGYRQIGYNIGGIAGSQSGYLTDSINYGNISGRKEVGGIVGQLEPTTTLEYEIDTLDILRGQLDSLNAIIDQTSEDAKNTTDTVKSLVDTLRDHLDDAEAAMNVLYISLDDIEEEKLPDWESYIDAFEKLNSSVSGITKTLDELAKVTDESADILNKDLEALEKQMDVINTTLERAEENLGGSVTDVSDEDTEEDTESKVSDCINYGDVLADLNAGGIAGAIAIENDLDPEDDIEIIGTESLNYETELRSVILRCENSGTVTVKKQNAGGIIGRMSMGLSKDCLNIGVVEAEGADYVGGIAGQSQGFIRSCSANCIVRGADYVGGITGVGTIISDCRAMAMAAGDEKLGALIGYAEEIYPPDGEVSPIIGNYYFAIQNDIGGIDGISYDDRAEPLGLDEFMALEKLPEVFRRVTISFIFEDGTKTDVTLSPGEGLDGALIPSVPEKEGYVGEWDGLSEADISELFHDMIFTLTYTARNTTIESIDVRENGLPILLAEGMFPIESNVIIESITKSPVLAEGENFIEAWKFSLPADSNGTRLRVSLPGGYEAKNITVMVRGTSGDWKKVDITESDSYAVFAIGADDEAFALVSSPDNDNYIIILAVISAASVFAITVVIVIIVHRRRKKQRLSTVTDNIED